MLTLSVSRGCEAVDGGALAWACRRPQGPRGTGSRMFDRWRSEPWTLQSHLMLYGAILSLPTLIFCGVLLFRSAVIERRQIERDTVDVVRSLAADIDSDLIATTTILRALATSPALSRGDIPMFERQMRAAVEPGVFELLLANQNGQQLINTRLAIGDALPKLNSVNWQTALSEQKAHRVRPLSRGHGAPLHLEHLDACLPRRPAGLRVDCCICTGARSRHPATAGPHPRVVSRRFRPPGTHHRPVQSARALRWPDTPG